VKVIGVRGSGEAEGSMGATIQSFSDGLKPLVTSRTDASGHYAYRADAFDSPGYTAPGVGLDHSINSIRAIMGDPNGQYYKSVAAGTSELRSQLATVMDALEAGPCGAITRVVLAGYSQGAHVIANVLADGMPRDWAGHIGAVVLFGDPTFNAKAKTVQLRSSFESSHNGVLGARSKDAFTQYQSTALNGKIFSFCHRADPVCQAVLDPLLLGSPHGDYNQADTSWAANLVAGVLYPPLKKADTAVITAQHADTQLIVNCDLPRPGTCYLHLTGVPDITGLSTTTRDVIAKSSTGKMTVTMPGVTHSARTLKFTIHAVTSTDGHKEGAVTHSFHLK
jgi:dienelactone hydrolase